jgi:hypothetical protein
MNIHFEDSNFQQKFCCFVSGLHWKAQISLSAILVFQKFGSSNNFVEKGFSPTILLTAKISYITLAHTFFMFISSVKINQSVLLFTLFFSAIFGTVNQ